MYENTKCKIIGKPLKTIITLFRGLWSPNGQQSELLQEVVQLLQTLPNSYRRYPPKVLLTSLTRSDVTFTNSHISTSAWARVTKFQHQV